MEILLRNFRENPMCWQDKPSLRLINEKTTRKELSTIRNVYLSLTEIASNHSNEKFSIFLFDIAKISGLSEKTIGKSLDHLKKIGLVYFKPQERGSDGKYKTKEIWLINNKETVGNIEESLKKHGRKLEENNDSKVTDIIENILEDNIENSLENKLESSPKGEEEETSLVEEKKVYGDPEINECLEIIAKYNNGILDGAKGEQRQYGNLLVKKLKKIDSVIAEKYTRQSIMEMILEIISENQFHASKISGPKKIYHELGSLMQICRQEFKAKEKKSIGILPGV